MVLAEWSSRQSLGVRNCYKDRGGGSQNYRYYFEASYGNYYKGCGIFRVYINWGPLVLGNSVQAQIISPLVFQEHTMTRASMPKS